MHTGLERRGREMEPNNGGCGQGDAGGEVHAQVLLGRSDPDKHLYT